MTMSGQIDIGWSVAPFGLKDLQAKTIRESLVELQRNKFNPKSAMNPNKLSDVDLVMQDAIVGKFLEKPLTQEQLAEFISAASRFVWFHVDRRGLWVLLCPRDVRYIPRHLCLFGFLSVLSSSTNDRLTHSTRPQRIHPVPAPRPHARAPVTVSGRCGRVC
jgi:hypothetical protein